MKRRVRKADVLSSTEMLTYKFSVFELVWSILIMLGVAAYAFFFASDSVAGASVQYGVATRIWNYCEGWIRSYAGEELMRLSLRVIGCSFAGLSSAVCFILVRSVLFFGMRKLRLIDFYRIHYRLFFWTLLAVLSISFSKFFIGLFLPVTHTSVCITLSCLTIGLAICYLRLSRPIILIAEYLLLGVLLAMSLSGVVVLLIAALILLVPNFYSERMFPAKWTPGLASDGAAGTIGGAAGGRGNGIAYSYGYGDDFDSSQALGVEKRELLNLLEERLRLSLYAFFLLGFIAVMALMFGSGMATGAEVKSVFLDWIRGFAAEINGLVNMKDLLAVICGIAIAVVFVLYRFSTMLNAEYYLTTSDLARFTFGSAVAFAVMIGIGKKFILTGDVSTGGIFFMPLAIQVLSAILILMSGAVLLVNMKCRRYYYEIESEAENQLVRKYKQMVIPLLLFFDIAPVAMFMVATLHVWRSFTF